jgi:hypothetical protein
VNEDWILLTDLAEELDISLDHPERSSIWTVAGFRPTRVIARSKTGLVRRWVVTVEQAQRVRELVAGAVTLS